MKLTGRIIGYLYSIESCSIIVRLLLDGLDREMDFCHSFDIFLFLSVMLLLLGQLSIYFYFPKANNFYQTTIRKLDCKA